MSENQEHILDSQLMENQRGIEYFFSFFSNYTGIFEPLLKLSIFFGVLISWGYFSFYVNALPSFSSLGDVTGYLIFIVLWSSIISGMILIISLFPSFVLFDEFAKRNGNSKTHIIITIGYFILIPILAFTLSVCYEKYQRIKDFFTYLMFTLIIVIPLITAYLLSNGNSKKEKALNSFSLFLALMFFSIVSTFAVFIFLETQLSMFLLLGIVILINLIILMEKELKIKTMLLLIFMFYSSLSLILGISNIDNPIIVKPFELLKLGHYKAELHFKDEFISKGTPFELNENNTTFATFDILSSIGDEYILKEIRHEEKISNTNKIVHAFKYNGINYYYEDNNGNIWIKNKEEFQKLDKVQKPVVSIAERLRKYAIDMNDRVYFINKNDVKFRLTGKVLKDDYTSWVVNR